MSNSEYVPKEHPSKDYQPNTLSADDVHHILTLAMEQDEQGTGTFSKAALSEMGA